MLCHRARNCLARLNYLAGQEGRGIRDFTFLTLRSHGKQNHSRQTGHQRAHRGSCPPQPCPWSSWSDNVPPCIDTGTVSCWSRRGHRRRSRASGPPSAGAYPAEQTDAGGGGQTQLIRVWQDLFNLYGLHIGQVMLLTCADLEDGRYPMPATPCALCSITASSPSSTRTTPWPPPRSGGDNDNLSARAAILADADCWSCSRIRRALHRRPAHQPGCPAHRRGADHR